MPLMPRSAPRFISQSAYEKHPPPPVLPPSKKLLSISLPKTPLTQRRIILVLRFRFPVHHASLVIPIDQSPFFTAAELATVAAAGIGASDIVPERRGRGQLGVAGAGVGIGQGGVGVVIFGDAEADAGLDGHARGVGVGGG